MLTIQLEAADPVLFGAARQLVRQWQGRVRFSLGRLAPARKTPWVRLARGSVVRSAVSVSWGVPFADGEAGGAWRLALTSAAWDDTDELEPWRLLAMPLPVLPRLGEPDPSREWVIVPRAALSAALLGEARGSLSVTRASGARLAAFNLPEGCSLGDLDCGGHAQFHFLGAMAALRLSQHVAWWTSRRVVASLLGHATTLVAPAGPLAFDAWRAGLEVLDPNTFEPLAPENSGQQLAGLVSPRLVRSSTLWRHVAEQTRAVAEGAIPVPLCTAQWLGQVDSVRQSAAGAVFKRANLKLQKFRRSPRRFCVESRSTALRAVGRQIWG